MLHPSLFHYNELTPHGVRPALPAACFDRRLPAFQPAAAVSPQVCQESTVPAETARFHRVADSLGTFATQLEKSGVMTLMISGAATWPGIVATASRLVIHVAQTAGTYGRVKDLGYTGRQAFVKTVWWTIMGR